MDYIELVDLLSNKNEFNREGEDQVHILHPSESQLVDGSLTSGGLHLCSGGK